MTAKNKGDVDPYLNAQYGADFIHESDSLTENVRRIEMNAEEMKRVLEMTKSELVILNPRLPRATQQGIAQVIANLDGALVALDADKTKWALREAKMELAALSQVLAPSFKKNVLAILKEISTALAAL